MGVTFHKARSDHDRIMAIIAEELKRDGFTEAKPIPKKGIWERIKELLKRLRRGNG